jgi:hypothetical protein|tara:strand:- start:591 stop:890 length:300 start_codon:yes stop_codon:yes gene_type:complete
LFGGYRRRRTSSAETLDGYSTWRHDERASREDCVVVVIVEAMVFARRRCERIPREIARDRSNRTRGTRAAARLLRDERARERASERVRPRLVRSHRAVA